MLLYNFFKNLRRRQKDCYIDNGKIIVCSAHIGESRENIGDILSAKAIAVLTGNLNVKIMYLPKDIGCSSEKEVIYGGGGMIRPGFANREVFQDLMLRNKKVPYSIYGVGINADVLSPDYSVKDKKALKKWLANATSVTVRDQKTKNFISTFSKKICQIAPCPTFQVIKKIAKHFNFKYDIGIVVSFGHTTAYKYYSNRIIKLVSDLIMLSEYSKVILICHDREDFIIAKELFPNIHSVLPKKFVEINKVYGECRGIITFRAHGIIFAAACYLPCSAIVLNVKIRSLYFYHYGILMPFKPNFNAISHLSFLKNNLLPIF